MKVIARHQVAYSNVLHTAQSGEFEMLEADYPQYINDVDKVVEVEKVKEVIPEVTKEVKKAPRNKKLNLKIRRTK